MSMAKHRCRKWFSQLGLAALCLAVVGTAFGPDPARGQTGPSFREAPLGTGGKRLTPTCRVTGIVSGGIINMASPEGVVAERSERLRGVATRLVTLEPVATKFLLVVTTEAGLDGEAAARLDRKLAAIEAAFQAGGLTVAARNTGPTAPGQTVDQAVGVQALFQLAGNVDPLVAMAMLPPGLIEALWQVEYEFPATSIIVDPIREELAREARSDALSRVAQRGEGAAIGKRIDLKYSDQSPRFPDPRSGRRVIEVGAVASYLLSRQPGFGLPK